MTSPALLPLRGVFFVKVQKEDAFFVSVYIIFLANAFQIEAVIW